MAYPDLSKLNESERQELMIKLLFDTKAMLVTLLEREAARMGTGPSMDAGQAEAYLMEAYTTNRLQQWEYHNVAPTTAAEPPADA